MIKSNIPFSIYKRKPHLIIPNLQPRDFSWGPKNDFETAAVKEPSVFEPLKFYCILKKKALCSDISEQICSQFLFKFILRNKYRRHTF